MSIPYEELLQDPDYQNDESKQFLKMMYVQHEHIPSFMAWEPDQYQSRALDETDVANWLGTVSDSEFVGASVMQWAGAWAVLTSDYAGPMNLLLKALLARVLRGKDQ